MYRLTALAALAAGLAALPAPADKPAEKAPVVAGNTAFALEMYAQFGKKEGNLFFSPYSISSALAMTSAGARGETLAEMEKALRFPPQEKLHPAFAALRADLNEAARGKEAFQLSTANRLWGQKGYPFKPEFLKLTADHYGAGLEEVDFVRATEAARRTINAWVEKETQDKIKELLQPNVVTSNTRLVLTNAIYFKGTWVNQFKKDQTREEPFFAADGKQTKAQMMNQTGRFPYAETADAQVLALPYRNGPMRMVVILPKKKGGLADVEKALSADKLAALDKLAYHQVEVALPKFKFTRDFDLIPELKALGMKRAFTPAADLSGLGGSPGELFITAVVHKAFVDVNEEGTEAAAATAVVVGKNGPGPGPAKAFRADHPFLFAVTDARSGSVLFLGRVSDPSK
jgi:serpin B